MEETAWPFLPFSNICVLPNYFPHPSRTSFFIESTMYWCLSRAIKCINCEYPSPFMIIGVFVNPDTWWLTIYESKIWENSSFQNDSARELLRLHITKFFQLSKLMLSEFLDSLQQLFWRIIYYYRFFRIWHNSNIWRCKDMNYFAMRQIFRGIFIVCRYCAFG